MHQQQAGDGDVVGDFSLVSSSVRLCIKATNRVVRVGYVACVRDREGEQDRLETVDG